LSLLPCSKAHGAVCDSLDGTRPPAGRAPGTMAERPRARFPTTICSLCAQDVVSKRSGQPEELISCADCGASGTPREAAAAAAATGGTLTLPPIPRCGARARPPELLGVRPQAGRGREAVPVAVQRVQAVPRLQPARRRRTPGSARLLPLRGPPVNAVAGPFRTAPRPRQDNFLLCDDCDKGYHTYCLDPPLEAIPDGAWSCERCRAGLDPSEVSPARQQPAEGEGQPVRRKVGRPRKTDADRAAEQARRMLWLASAESKRPQRLAAITARASDSWQESGRIPAYGAARGGRAAGAGRRRRDAPESEASEVDTDGEAATPRAGKQAGSSARGADDDRMALIEDTLAAWSQAPPTVRAMAGRGAT